MRQLQLIITAETKRQIILFKRYPFEPISSLIAVVVGFIALYFSVDISVNEGSADLTDLFIRYTLGMLSMFMIAEMGINISRESQVGTLERIYTMPSRIFSVITIRNFVTLLYNILQLTLFVALFTLIFNIKISWNAGMLLLLCSFIISLLGVGYLLSGLTLVYKKIGSVAQLLQFVFLFIALLPYEKLSVSTQYIIGYFPGAMAVQLLNVSQSLHLLHFKFIVSLVYAFSHLLIGIILFKKLERTALKKGALGKY